MKDTTDLREVLHRYGVWQKALMAALTGLLAHDPGPPASVMDYAAQFADEAVERDKAWRKARGLE